MQDKKVPPVCPPVPSPPKKPIDPRTLKVLGRPEAPDSPSVPADPENKARKTLNDWRGSVTTFKGFTGTRPAQEVIDAPWDEVKALLCPDKPALLTDKKHGVYFVPCELKEAPLVGNTLEIAKNNGAATTGKMRSKSHATEASLLVMDVDGLSKEELDAGLEKIRLDSITYLAFTTHSHGNPDKPGMRIRIVVPLNQPVGIDDYAAAWHGLDQLYFESQAGKADSSGANMYQQQGTWTCHPDRADQAKMWIHNAEVAKADVLIEAGTIVQDQQTLKTAPAKTRKNVTTPSLPLTDATYPAADADKVADACQQIGAFRKNKGAGQSEPLWRDCLGVVGHCTDGKKLCHEWSSGHPGYDETETQTKLAYRMRMPPTTCQQFRKTNPEGCHGCIQRRNSPITLGWKPADALTTIQRKFALIKMDGKLCMLDRDSLNEFTEQGVAKKLELSSLNDGKLLIRRALKARFPQTDPYPIVNEFFESPETILYHGVEFNPKGTSHSHLNLWVDPTVSPHPGPWTLIEAFLREVICGGNSDAYEYLIHYIAHALQHPEEKPGVMVIMVGGQGVGKGTLGRILQKIWSATYIQINNIDNITGSFNAALERSFVVFLDEALFSGNRRASDALKSLVTEPTIQINEKYQPSRQIRSYHRFIAATNAAHFKNTDRDDRRDFTLRVSDAKKGDFDYWNKLNHEIEHGGVEAMAFDLMQMDLASFNVRNKPDTGELLEQKLMSLDPIPRWWHDLLLVDGVVDESDWPDFISTSTIINGVVEVTGGRLYQKPSAQTIAMEMLKLCPSAKKMQKQEQFERSRGYSLPSLQQARAEFEEYIGGTVQWDDEEDASLT